ncbi:hypothetical protein [Abyssalbus ytuae]|uniref:Uncharacterized protein n=1 Tax=Abyssalbus ytuae TaxID=2926907 RepID=A0A9E6ZXX9_9FLAO|nr:hypothetical protein [Abyssalbus ytuae]UOB15921.1 hypothetical protein MQE35_09230 [Abyssalbus ytuae]
MKFISLIFLTVITLKGCSQEKSAQENNIVVEYEASSRGFFNQIKVTKDSIYKSNDRSEKSMRSTLCTDSQWKKITAKIEGIDIDKLETLEPPTDKRTYDAAAHATLTIKKNDSVYKTQTFDSGNPPKEIESLVKAILTLGKTVE